MTTAKHCSRCKASFDCGRDDHTCWCVELPKVPLALLQPEDDCLCPDCLRDAARTREPAASGERST